MDRSLAEVLGYAAIKLVKALLPKTRMQPFSIVERLEALKNDTLCFPKRRKLTLFDLAFSGPKETFRHRTVVAVSCESHALPHSMTSQRTADCIAFVLASTVTVKFSPGNVSADFNRREERLGDKGRLHVLFDSPSDDFAAMQALNDS